MSEQSDNVDQAMSGLLRQSREAVEAQVADEGRVLLEEATVASQETTLETELAMQTIALRALMLKTVDRAKSVRPRRLWQQAHKLAAQNPQLDKDTAYHLLDKKYRHSQSTTVPSPGARSWHLRTAPLRTAEAETGPEYEDRFTQSWFIELDNRPRPSEPGLRAAAALAIHCQGHGEQTTAKVNVPIYALRAGQYEGGRYELTMTHEGQPAAQDELYVALGFIQIAKDMYQ